MNITNVNNFPALRMLVANYSPNKTKPYLLIIGHMLPTANAFIDTLARVFSVEVIGIPYSFSKASPNTLTAVGYNMIVPSKIDQIPTVALETIEKLAKHGRPIIVQEVGGYLADFGKRLSEYEHFLGVVEDTNNGHWRYEARQHTLNYPVVSIAQSPIKAIEDAQIGDAVVYSVERVLREHFYAVVKGMNVLVLGFGSIGASCANALRRRAANTVVFDVDQVKVLRACMDGFHVGPLETLLPEIDIVIGTTGHGSIDISTAGLIKNGAVVVSASSKQVEFDIQSLQQKFVVTRVGADVDRYSCGDHYFYLLSDAYPINFRDNSVIGEVLDAIYSELFVCIREVAECRVEPGLWHSWPQLHQEVAEAWCKTHIGNAIHPQYLNHR